MIHINYKSSGGSVIVVGGNSGIGQALIKKLQASEVNVLSIDIQDQTQNETNVFLKYYKSNPLAKASLRRILIDIKQQKMSVIGLVNLSGTIAYFGTIEDASPDDWNETYDISFQSCLNSCQVFSTILKERKGASIVNMSSGLAFIGQKNYGPYSAAKAAIVSLTKTLAVELGPEVRVNSVAPGAVDTPFIYDNQGKTRFDIEGYKSRVPTGAIATPGEIADVILYLLSDGSSHISGECIHVNGGVG